jgi:hypothetical protein
VGVRVGFEYSARSAKDEVDIYLETIAEESERLMRVDATRVRLIIRVDNEHRKNMCPLRAPS